MKEVLKGYRLPSFPAVITEALEKIRDPNASASDIARIIEVDPGLSVKVLRMANSPAFSPIRRIENLNQAVALIGLSQMETLILSVVVANATPKRSSKGFDPARFWRAAARRGVLARAFAPLVSTALESSSQESETFTAGFLQDMAIPFLSQAMPEEYGAILERWHAGEGPLNQLEHQFFEWDHAEVATWVSHEWRLPESIASAIGGHHEPENKLYICPQSVALVSLIREDADQSLLEDLLDTAASRYGISKEEATSLVEAGFEKADDLARLMI